MIRDIATSCMPMEPVQNHRWRMFTGVKRVIFRVERHYTGCADYEYRWSDLCGATDNILLSSTIGRNKTGYRAKSFLPLSTEPVHWWQNFEMGVNIYETGGETADVGDLVRTIIVDSTVTRRMKRSDVIDNANIQPGDVIVGLSSCGQATTKRNTTAEWAAMVWHLPVMMCLQPSCWKISRKL